MQKQLLLQYRKKNWNNDIGCGLLCGLKGGGVWMINTDDLQKQWHVWAKRALGVSQAPFKEE